MKNSLLLISLSFSCLICFSQTRIRSLSSSSSNKIKKDDYKIIEAESYSSQKPNKGFKWFKFTKGIELRVKRDEDKTHYKNCSNNSYVEILPTKKVPEKMIGGKTFFPTPGESAILKYKVNFKSTGKYYVWVRGLSNHSHDNSIHVGLNGEWPNSGKALYWCPKDQGKWSWSSKQRMKTDDCTPNSERIYINVTSTGIQSVEFSMREYGLEFDKFVLTKFKNKRPK